MVLAGRDLPGFGLNFGNRPWPSRKESTTRGFLATSSGSPVNGTVNLTFSIYSVASGGTALWSETHSGVSVSRGVFSVILGQTTPITAQVLDGDRWLGIRVGSGFGDGAAQTVRFGGIRHPGRPGRDIRGPGFDRRPGFVRHQPGYSLGIGRRVRPAGLLPHLGRHRATGDRRGGFLRGPTATTRTTRNNATRALWEGRGPARAGPVSPSDCSGVAGQAYHATSRGLSGEHVQTGNFGYIASEAHGVLRPGRKWRPE